MTNTTWNKSVRIKRRLIDKIQYNQGIPYYNGRRVIEKDSPIDGGVCLGEGEREAIVIDSVKYPEIRRLYEIAKKKATRKGRINKNYIIYAVYNTVKEALPEQNNNLVEQIAAKYEVSRDKEIPIDIFVINQTGVCRQDALLCGVLLEKFKKDGYVRGKISIDRNSRQEGGHVWCRYTNSAGEVTILDVAQNFFDDIEKATEKTWSYKRPTDK